MVPFETASIASRIRPAPEVVSVGTDWPSEAVTNCAAFFCAVSSKHNNDTKRAKGD